MATVRLEGFDAFRAALAALPEALQREAAPIVRDTVEGMAADVRAQYPLGDTEHLVAGVRSSMDSPLSGRVRTTARHAHLYEYGTVARFTKASGAARGTMPARPVFIPTAIRWRERMFGRLEREILQQPRPTLGEGTLG